MDKSNLEHRVGKIVWGLIAIALGIKAVVFLYITFGDPLLMMQADSYGYLSDAKAWVQYLSVPFQGLHHSFYRTPGYSLFLAIFHFWCNLPLLGIVFLQIALNILTAIIVFKIVRSMDQLTALLSAAIVLLDLPMTIFSSMILTESLYVFVLSLFLYSFIKYISVRHISWLLGSAVLLAASVYIRPVGYFLGLAVAGYILYLWGMKKVLIGLAHAGMVIVIVYGALFIWQYHNLKAHSSFTFSNIGNATINMHGIIGRYVHETDPQLRAMPPVLYYIDSIGRNFLDLMTTPGSMRCLHSKGWYVFGSVFGYAFVIFWWIGLIAGVKKCMAGLTGQFVFLLLLYFAVISLVSTGWNVTPRFRVPMVPSIAIIAAQGWMSLLYKSCIP